MKTLSLCQTFKGSFRWPQICWKSACGCGTLLQFKKLELFLHFCGNTHVCCTRMRQTHVMWISLKIIQSHPFVPSLFLSLSYNCTLNILYKSKTCLDQKETKRSLAKCLPKLQSLANIKQATDWRYFVKQKIKFLIKSNRFQKFFKLM